MIYAAIDIGSNAGRLLIGDVLEKEGSVHIRKISLTRVPLRLGEDVFENKKISKERARALVKTMKAYRHLMEVYEVKYFMACATSAMREAENRKDIVKLVKEETGIELDVITGDLEADYILSTFFTQNLDKDQEYLYIDVGGGSTEISLLLNGEKESRSFKIGTIRMLKGKVPEHRWIDMKNWVKEITKNKKNIVAIGTGGNINRILKLNRKEDNFLNYKEIKDIQAYVSSYTLEDRIAILGMRPDRADVIVPAADIYLAAMKYANIQKILVPKIGLSDGMIYQLYSSEKKKEREKEKEKAKS
jgi:exopolyphosphatase/guanosine-5'-triphosphate,3'-diphosphate pyrophosphatase